MFGARAARLPRSPPRSATFACTAALEAHRAARSAARLSASASCCDSSSARASASAIATAWVPPRRPSSWWPGHERGHRPTPRADDQRAAPRRSPQLVRREREQVGRHLAQRRAQPCPPPAPRRCETARRARGTRAPPLRTGCTTPGLVVHPHQLSTARCRASARRALLRVDARPSAPGCTRTTVAPSRSSCVDRAAARTGARWPTSRCPCAQARPAPRQAPFTASAFDLRARGGEDHLPRRAAQRPRDPLPRRVEPRARRPPGAVHARRVAHRQLQRRARAASATSGRSGVLGVVIEVDHHCSRHVEQRHPALAARRRTPPSSRFSTSRLSALRWARVPDSGSRAPAMLPCPPAEPPQVRRSISRISRPAFMRRSVHAQRQVELAAVAAVGERPASAPSRKHEPLGDLGHHVGRVDLAQVGDDRVGVDLRPLDGQVVELEVPHRQRRGARSAESSSRSMRGKQPQVAVDVGVGASAARGRACRP